MARLIPADEEDVGSVPSIYIRFLLVTKPTT